VAGAVFGQLLGAFSKSYTRFLSLKWQLVTCCVIFTAFTGGMAAVTASHISRAIVFSILSSMMIGYMEVLTLAGAPLMVDPKDLGLANGVEYTVRSGFSVLAGICSSSPPGLNRGTDNHDRFHLRDDCKFSFFTCRRVYLTGLSCRTSWPQIWRNMWFLSSSKQACLSPLFPVSCKLSQVAICPRWRRYPV